MIYTFVTVEMETTTQTGTPKITEPLWKVSVPVKQECRGRFFQGFSNETATYFIVLHKEDETPHFNLLMDPEIDLQRDPVYAIGLEQMFIQDVDWSATRFSFSWASSSPANTYCTISADCSCHVMRYICCSSDKLFTSP